MNVLLMVTLLALVAPILAEENAAVSAADVKKQEKRGVVDIGYGSHYPGAYGAHGFVGYGGYPAYGGFGHKYVANAAPFYPTAPLLAHGIAAAAPAVAHHSYSAPISVAHGYNAASLLSAAAPWRVGYNGLHGATGYGHGLSYVNGW